MEPEVVLSPSGGFFFLARLKDRVYEYIPGCIDWPDSSYCNVIKKERRRPNRVKANKVKQKNSKGGIES